MGHFVTVLRIPFNGVVPLIEAAVRGETNETVRPVQNDTRLRRLKKSNPYGWGQLDFESGEVKTQQRTASCALQWRDREGTLLDFRNGHRGGNTALTASWLSLPLGGGGGQTGGFPGSIELHAHRG